MSARTTLVRRVALWLAWLMGIALFSLQFACRTAPWGRQQNRRADNTPHHPHPTLFQEAP